MPKPQYVQFEMTENEFIDNNLTAPVREIKQAARYLKSARVYSDCPVLVELFQYLSQPSTQQKVFQQRLLYAQKLLTLLVEYSDLNGLHSHASIYSELLQQVIKGKGIKEKLASILQQRDVPFKSSSLPFAKGVEQIILALLNEGLSETAFYKYMEEAKNYLIGTQLTVSGKDTPRNGLVVVGPNGLKIKIITSGVTSQDVGGDLVKFCQSYELIRYLKEKFNLDDNLIYYIVHTNMQEVKHGVFALGQASLQKQMELDLKENSTLTTVSTLVLDDQHKPISLDNRSVRLKQKRVYFAKVLPEDIGKYKDSYIFTTDDVMHRLGYVDKQGKYQSLQVNDTKFNQLLQAQRVKDKIKSNPDGTMDIYSNLSDDKLYDQVWSLILDNSGHSRYYEARVFDVELIETFNLPKSGKTDPKLPGAYKNIVKTSTVKYETDYDDLALEVDGTVFSAKDIAVRGWLERFGRFLNRTKYTSLVGFIGFLLGAGLLGGGVAASVFLWPVVVAIMGLPAIGLWVIAVITGATLLGGIIGAALLVLAKGIINDIQILHALSKQPIHQDLKIKESECKLIDIKKAIDIDYLLQLNTDDGLKKFGLTEAFWTQLKPDLINVITIFDKKAKPEQLASLTVQELKAQLSGLLPIEPMKLASVYLSIYEPNKTNNTSERFMFKYLSLQMLQDKGVDIVGVRKQFAAIDSFKLTISPKALMIAIINGLSGEDKTQDCQAKTVVELKHFISDVLISISLISKEKTEEEILNENMKFYLAALKSDQVQDKEMVKLFPYLVKEIAEEKKVESATKPVQEKINVIEEFIAKSTKRVGSEISKKDTVIREDDLSPRDESKLKEDNQFEIKEEIVDIVKKVEL